MYKQMALRNLETKVEPQKENMAENGINSTMLN